MRVFTAPTLLFKTPITAVAVNLTAVYPTGPTDVRAYPVPLADTGTFPVVSNLNATRTVTVPNLAVVKVPDERLDRLSALFEPKKTTHAALEFVDIAGLVRGASKGEGLGNQFLGNIREVDAVAHVLRCFSDPDVVHVDGAVDPERDRESEGGEGETRLRREPRALRRDLGRQPHDGPPDDRENPSARRPRKPRAGGDEEGNGRRYQESPHHPAGTRRTGLEAQDVGETEVGSEGETE